VTDNKIAHPSQPVSDLNHLGDAKVIITVSVSSLFLTQISERAGRMGLGDLTSLFVYSESRMDQILVSGRLV
jgi:hypothetical protein